MSKFVTSQSGKQMITIHVLPNISRSKGIQTMKFGQLIEYNINIVLEKPYTNVVEKLVPFMKYQILWIKSGKCYKICFYCNVLQSRSTKIFNIKVLTTCFYLM